MIEKFLKRFYTINGIMNTLSRYHIVYYIRYIIYTIYYTYMYSYLTLVITRFCEHMHHRAADFRCRILDNELFISNLSGSCELVMTNLSPTEE